MNREIAELTVKSSIDYNDKVVTALQDAGFIIILSAETTSDKYYIVAESERYAITYKNRKEQRNVNETMSSLLLPLKNSCNENVCDCIDITLRILAETGVGKEEE